MEGWLFPLSGNLISLQSFTHHVSHIIVYRPSFVVRRPSSLMCYNLTLFMSSLSTWRWTIPLLAGIMLTGLLLRLVFFSASLPFGGFPLVVDEGNYFGIAGPLSEGQGFVDKWAWLRPPGYPAFLAFFLAVWRSLPAAALAQILLSVANIGLLYALEGDNTHGSTYGGNPVACAAALATIELLEEGLIENAATVGPILMAKLTALKSRHAVIGDVRGLGLMLGVDFEDSGRKPDGKFRNRVMRKSFEKGLLLLSCGESTLRFCPPLVVTQDEIVTAVEIFDSAIVDTA